MKTTLTYLLGAGCLAAAAPTNTTAAADSTASAVNGTSTLNSTSTNTTTLDAPTNAKVWIVAIPADPVDLNEVVATWDPVPGAAKYRLCHDDPTYLKRCTVVSENKYNLGYTLDADYVSDIDEEKRRKLLWSVRAEGAGGATANGTSVSEWATVQLQSNGTALAQGVTLHCSKEKRAANDNEFKWEVTAKVKEPAEGVNATSAIIDATWSVGQTTGDKFTLPEGSMYEACVHTEGFNDETDQWTEECMLYPNTTTLTNILATNISKTAFRSRLELSVTNLCTRGYRDQGLSETFTLRRLSSQFNATKQGLCIGAVEEGTSFAAPKAVKCSANTTARFDYVNSMSPDGGFRFKLVIPGAENGFGEGSRRECLTVNDESKLEFKVCSDDDKKYQSWTQEKIMVSGEGSSRGESIYCIVSVANPKNALVVGKEGEAVKVGDCAKNRATWEQGDIKAYAA